MNRQTIHELAQDLSHRRFVLLRETAENQEEMKAILDQEQSELEETAQQDHITRMSSRLNQRDRQKIREIDGALDRMSAGIYGKCEECEQEIGSERLRALPTATLCINCASARENKTQAGEAEELSERLPLRRRETEDSGEE
jgi:DnaK suppressor protein